MQTEHKLLLGINCYYETVSFNPVKLKINTTAL